MSIKVMLSRRHELFPNEIIPNVKIPNPKNGENPEFFVIILGIFGSGHPSPSLAPFPLT
jgi:hypothetical protein